MKFDRVNNYQVGIFMYRHLHNMLPDSLIKYFTKVEDVHEHNTRFSRSLSIQYARTNYYRFSNACRGPKIWNATPASIKEATAVAVLGFCVWGLT